MTTLQSQTEYDHWATAQVIHALAEIDQSLPEHGESRALLAHNLAARGIWLWRITGDQSFFAGQVFWEPEAAPDLELLANWSVTVRDQWLGWAATESGQDLDRVITYAALDGSSWSNSVDEIAEHVLTHGFYHRGQIARRFRIMGHDAPETGFIFYHRDRRARTAPAL
jgi:uncharacterized damage-inducible protein DinB